MKTAFLDTAYLLALEMPADQYHRAAQHHWRAVRRGGCRLVTTSFVFTEVVTFLNRRGHHAKARQIGSALLHSPSIRFIHIDETLFLAGWEYFQRHRDKTYSLTDCVSFAIMQREDIGVAYTFDEHFRQAGFEVEP